MRGATARIPSLSAVKSLPSLAATREPSWNLLSSETRILLRAGTGLSPNG